MMPDFVDDFDDQDAGLIDQHAIEEILRRLEDNLRSLGLTMITDQVAITVNKGDTYMMIPALIRPSAKKKLKEDRDSREAMNRMMADQAEAELKERARRLAELAADPERLAQELFGDGVEEEDDCQHHAPDGICVKCGKVMDI